MLRQVLSLRKVGGGLGNLLHVTGTTSPLQRRVSPFFQLGKVKRHRNGTLQTQRNNAGDSTKMTLEESIANIVNRDRLILLGLGGVFIGLLFLDSKKRNQNDIFRKKALKIHESVTKAQENVNEGNYPEAVKLYRAAMELAKSEPKEDVSHQITLEIVDQLANLAYELNDWQEAEELFKETLQRMVDIGYEKDSDAVIEASMKLAKVYVAMGNNDLATEGFKFCKETLDAKIQTLSDIPDDTLALFGMTLTEYGTHYKAIGQLDESERAFSRALAIAKQVLGPVHGQTSVIANDLATVYDEKGRYNKAERLVHRAISIARTTSPENLPAYTYNLGYILMHKGEFSKAKKSVKASVTPC